MKIRKLFLAAACLLSASLIFAQEEDELESVKDSPDPVLQHELIMTISGYEMNLNPNTASYNSEAQLLNGLYEGLFSYDARSLDPVNALAQSYKISKDKKRWTFKLRKDAKFSDGTPITAQSVKDSWLRLLSTPDAPYASLLDCISKAGEFRTGNAKAEDVGITVRDDLTLVVTLNSPTAYFARLLCHHAFAVSKEDLSVFSGAYVISEKSEESLRLVKNENYWDARHVSIPSILIQLSSSDIENAWAFNTGKTDWVVSMVDTEKMLNKNSVRISAIFGTSYLFFSCKNAPWDRADFRNALLTAVPWKEFRSPFLIPATTLVYPISGYRSPEGLAETSEEDAIEMMDQARKDAGIPADQKLKITYAIAKESEIQKKQYELLKKAWEPLGVELLVQTTTDDRYIDSIESWNADIFAYSWIGDYADPSAFLELFREGSTLNETKWVNEEFTKTLRQSDETADQTERFKLLSKAEEILLNDGMIMPISHSLSLHALDLNSIGGWYSNALDIHPFKTLYFKENTTTQVPNIVMAK